MRLARCEWAGFSACVTHVLLPVMGAMQGLACNPQRPGVQASRDAEGVQDAPQGGTQARAESLALGGARSCAVLIDQTVRCWGLNPGGLSLPGETRDESATPTAIGGLRNVEQLAVAESHACAVVKGGGVWCWGTNDKGELGDGTTTGRVAPAVVAGADRVLQVVAGEATEGGGGFSCALRDDGSVLCWGSGDGGVLRATSSTPTPISGVDHAVRLAAGRGHVCAVRADGHVVCWGRDDHGQSGAPRAPRIGPTVVAGVDHAVDIAAGPTHTCVRLRDATASCWGDNAGQQLGEGPEQTAAPMALKGASDVAELALGRNHSCLRTGDGRVLCVGGSDRGPFGYSSECARPHRRLIPGTSGVMLVSCAALTEVRELRGAVELRHGSEHACARFADGTARCWGGTGHSELGNHALGAAASKTPVAVDLDSAPPPPVTRANQEDR
jgi:alpha-tubulin suppressor-like RCC1 family protein